MRPVTQPAANIAANTPLRAAEPARRPVERPRGGKPQHRLIAVSQMVRRENTFAQPFPRARGRASRLSRHTRDRPNPHSSICAARKIRSAVVPLKKASAPSPPASSVRSGWRTPSRSACAAASARQLWMAGSCSSCARNGWRRGCPTITFDAPRCSAKAGQDDHAGQRRGTEEKNSASMMSRCKPRSRSAGGQLGLGQKGQKFLGPGQTSHGSARLRFWLHAPDPYH